MHNELPQTGFLRLYQIIGQEAVTEDQAKKNRKRGKGPRRPRQGTPAVVPIKKSCWWTGILEGRFPKPVKLSPHVTMWRVEDIRALLERIAAGGAR